MSNRHQGSPSGLPAAPRRIGLKYCGGCAPRYDRVEQVRIISTSLRGMVDLLPSGERNLEAILVVAGCPTCCVETRAFEPLPILRIRSEADTRLLIDEIKAEPSRDLAGSTLSVVG